VNRQHSTLYEANARILLREISDGVGHAATFADVPESWIERLASQGFEWLWLLGVWQTGEAGRRLAQSLEWLWAESRERLPGFTTEDVFSSPFAVQRYTAHQDFGGSEALAVLRRRLARHGIRLMLDFVPNHFAADHRWASEAPERFVAGTEELIRRQPANYARLANGILAHGRDPNFPGWTDTLQLNYSRRGTREAMAAELAGVAAQCDGVRCDMAMLVLKEVFASTWPQEPWEGEDEFWPAAIEAVRRQSPGFVFAAEAYWGLEGRLIEQGFDYAYDKEFYDELLAGNAGAIRQRLAGGADRLRRGIRFIENHDEPRARAAFSADALRPAATLAALTPGLFLLHDGQAEGRRFRLPVQLGARPHESRDPGAESLYERILEATRRPEVRQGRWELLNPMPAWEGNPTWERYVAFRWGGEPGEELLCAANLSPNAGQCFIRLPAAVYQGETWVLRDLLSPNSYERSGDEMASRGLYLDMPAWGVHVFAVERARV